MKAAEDLLQTTDGQIDVILTDRTIAALSQLDAEEKYAVLDAIRALQSYGLHEGPDLVLDRLSEPMGTYVIRVHTPSDLRLVVRTESDSSIIVLSLFRAETLRGLFHAS